MKTTIPDDNALAKAPTEISWEGAFARFGKMKILAIDDEPANIALLEGLLGDCGYTRVKSITDSRLALETWRTFQPDLILLDLMMPHLDGFAVLEALRSEATRIFADCRFNRGRKRKVQAARTAVRRDRFFLNHSTKPKFFFASAICSRPAVSISRSTTIALRLKMQCANAVWNYATCVRSWQKRVASAAP